MITAVVVDDEEPAREELKYLLAQDPEIIVIGEAGDGSEAYGLIQSLRPQVAFLDIQMPDLDGFGLAQLLMKQENLPLIIFTTAYNQYAVKAFEHAALDYLLKPISPTRLEQTLQRTKNIIKSAQLNHWQGQVEEFLEKFKKSNKLERLPVLENEKVILLQPEEIICVESQGRGTKIITAQATYCSDYSLNELEEKLKDYYFLKTHRSFLVNLKEVREVIPWFNHTLMLKVKGYAQDIPVSRTFLKEFKQHLPCSNFRK